mgnify:CR=1 FL=1
MENQKSVVEHMTTEQYFALKCEIIRRRDSAEIMFFVFMTVGIALITIGAALNSVSVNSTWVIMLLLPFFLLIFFMSKTKSKLDRLHIEYSMGESFYYAAIKLHLMEEKYKDKEFRPSLCESQ